MQIQIKTNIIKNYTQFVKSCLLYFKDDFYRQQPIHHYLQTTLHLNNKYKKKKGQDHIRHGLADVEYDRGRVYY